MGVYEEVKVEEEVVNVKEEVEEVEIKVGINKELISLSNRFWRLRRRL